MIWFVGYVLCYLISVASLLKAAKNNDGYIGKDAMFLAFSLSLISPISTLIGLTALVASSSKLELWLSEKL